MARTRRTFTREFKLDICRQIVSGEATLAQLSREHSLSRSVLERWRDAYRERGEGAFSHAPVADDQALREAQRRIAELEASLGRAHLEVELLKRVVDIQGNRQRRSTP